MTDGSDASSPDRAWLPRLHVSLCEAVVTQGSRAWLEYALVDSDAARGGVRPVLERWLALETWTNWSTGRDYRYHGPFRRDQLTPSRYRPVEESEARAVFEDWLNSTWLDSAGELVIPEQRPYRRLFERALDQMDRSTLCLLWASPEECLSLSIQQGIHPSGEELGMNTGYLEIVALRPDRTGVVVIAATDDY